MRKLFSLFCLFPIFLCVSADEIALDANLKRGQLLIKQNRTDEALALFENGIQQAKKEKNLLCEGKFYLAVADLLLLLNRVDSLDSYYGKAATIFEKLNLQPQAIRAKTGMLEIARRTNPSSTMDKYLDLLKQAREINDNDVYYNVLDKIILVNIGMENYVDAFAQQHECITYYKSEKDTLLLAMKYRELGSLFFTHFTTRPASAYEKDSCIYYLQKSIKLFYQINSFRNLVFAYQRLAWLLYPTDLSTAWSYIQIADSLDKRYNIQSPQLPNIMSFCLFKMGKTKEAIEKSKEALRLGMKAKQLFIGIQASDALCEYYKSIKEVDSALFYKELSGMINDSIRSQKHYKDAVRMQAKMEYDKEMFQKEIVQQEEVKRQKLIKNYSLLGVGLLLIIVLLVYRAYAHTKKTQKLISQQNEEKSVLLKEIHHRVKNNLSVISSILDLQQRGIDNPQMHDVFKDAKSRISSMALVHKNLYEQENITSINVQQYFENLYSTIYNSYKPKGIVISNTINCQSVEMNIDTLIPLALIVNELLTNSFKYAFDGRQKGGIGLSLKKIATGFELTYEDDGIGIKTEEGKQAKQGMGTMLIKGLSNQLHGNSNKISSNEGLKYIISFAGINPQP